MAEDFTIKSGPLEDDASTPHSADADWGQFVCSISESREGGRLTHELEPSESHDSNSNAQQVLDELLRQDLFGAQQSSDGPSVRFEKLSNSERNLAKDAAPLTLQEKATDFVSQIDSSGKFKGEFHIPAQDILRTVLQSPVRDKEELRQFEIEVNKQISKHGLKITFGYSRMREEGKYMLDGSLQNTKTGAHTGSIGVQLNNLSKEDHNQIEYFVERGINGRGGANRSRNWIALEELDATNLVVNHVDFANGRLRKAEELQERLLKTHREGAGAVTTLQDWMNKSEFLGGKWRIEIDTSRASEADKGYIKVDLYKSTEREPVDRLLLEFKNPPYIPQPPSIMPLTDPHRSDLLRPRR